jgi:hypothetical protein
MKALCSCVDITANKASGSLARVLTVRPMPRFVAVRTVSLWIYRPSREQPRVHYGTERRCCRRALKQEQLREGLAPQWGTLPGAGQPLNRGEF